MGVLHPMRPSEFDSAKLRGHVQIKTSMAHATLARTEEFPYLLLCKVHYVLLTSGFSPSTLAHDWHTRQFNQQSCLELDCSTSARHISIVDGILFR